MKLHLLFALLAGLVAMVTAQNDPRDFEVLELTDDPDDLSAGDMKELQQRASQALSQLDDYVLSSIERRNMQRARGEVPLAPGYTAAMDADISMFDNSSASDVLWPGGNNTTITTTTTTTPTATRSPRSQTLSRAERDIQTHLYYCPHRNYLLNWFPASSGRICFVPWAWRQAITYARCNVPSCRVRLNRSGRCRPSCFTRRYIFAFCFQPSTGNWSWRWEIKNLPQACRCSSC